MKPIESSALIGLGALGILFGWPMQRHTPAGRFCVIADAPRIARYQAEPALFNGERCDFRYCTPEQGAPADLVLVAVKATALEAAARQIRPFVGPDTVIISVLNGITSEETLERLYPGRLLWSVALGMDATRTGRTLACKNPGLIQLGERDGSITPRLQAAAEYLAGCGIRVEVCTDILYKQWHKLMMNDGLNQAAAVYGLTYGGLRSPGPAQDAMMQAMHEVVTLAGREGVPLPADAPETWLRGMMPAFAADAMPSMRQDVLARRPTEVEQFAGVICRLGKKHGVPTPVNDFFYARIREIEAGWAQQGHAP